jgi:hypothetical protein
MRFPLPANPFARPDVGARRILAGVDFRIEQRVTASTDAVARALVDASFVAATAELPKIGGAELLDQQRDDNRVRQRIRYRFTGELSAAVTAVVNRDRLTWVDEAEHDLTTFRSEHRILPDHYADRLQATYATELSPDGDAERSRMVVTGTVKVRMPLVGGRVERAIVSGLEEHAAAEAELLGRWLDGSAE